MVSPDIARPTWLLDVLVTDGWGIQRAACKVSYPSANAQSTTQGVLTENLKQHFSPSEELEVCSVRLLCTPFVCGCYR